jgi:hypothetical protein
MYIETSNSNITVSQDRQLETLKTYALKAEDWKDLSLILKNAEIENLDKLKAPTDKRLFDGAAHATLSISNGDIEIVTPTFDHGYPPKAIETLVNKVLSLAENVTKQ